MLYYILGKKYQDILSKSLSKKSSGNTILDIIKDSSNISESPYKIGNFIKILPPDICRYTVNIKEVQKYLKNDFTIYMPYFYVGDPKFRNRS
jgi:hypothetical protein